MRPVLLVGPYPPPFGGPGVHMMHLRRSLEERGVPCEVVNIGVRRRDPNLGARPVRSGLDFVMAVAWAARRGYHTHHFFNLESHKAILLATAAAALTRLCGASYSVGFIGGPSQKHLGRPGAFWTRLGARPLRAAEFIICNNDAVKAALRRLCPDDTKIHPIECFYDGQVASLGAIPPDVRAFMDTHAPVLSTITHPRLETTAPHHELELLIEALRLVRHRHPRVGCVVLGGADAVGHYGRLAAQAGMDDLFRFAGELRHEDCLAVIKSSSVFVRAYLKDGSSSSVREALALGAPTVACANPQHPPAVIPFTPNDPHSLAETLLDALGREAQLRQRLAAAPPVTARSLDRELSLLAGCTRP